MQYLETLDSDISKSKALTTFLRTSFKGSSFGNLQIDDCCDAVDRVLTTAQELESRLPPY